MNPTRDQVLQIINDTTGQYSDVMKDIARKQLLQIDAQAQQATTTSSGEPSVADLLTALNAIITSTGQQVDEDEVNRLIKEQLRKFKFGLNNLDDATKSWIARNSQTVTIQTMFEGNIISTNVGKQQDLFYILLSEHEAGNNVYLYGGAGTGKTFIAKAISDALNYDLITVNCNQFTSPADIIGGQTIEGYQEGKLTRAWGNLGLSAGKNGCVLLLDELPKIDANTAGVMNDALSKKKDPRKKVDGVVQPLYIENGRGEKIALKNCFIIGTGNSKLNVADPDYEANFKQDLSLQDRFVGSTYQVFINYEYELNNFMRFTYMNEVVDLSWLWNYLIKLREAIIQKGYTNRAFVSGRLMINLRDSYMVEMSQLNTPFDTRLPAFKTLKMAIRGFLDLFTENQRNDLESEIHTDQFFTYVDEKIKLPLNQQSSQQDKDESDRLINAWRATISQP